MKTLNEAALLAAQKITASILSGMTDSLGRIVEDAPPESLLEVQKHVKSTILLYIQPWADELEKMESEMLFASRAADSAIERIKDLEATIHKQAAILQSASTRRKKLEAKLAEVTAERDRLMEAAKAFQDLTVCYRVGKKPNEALFQRLKRAKAALEAK